MPSHIVSAELTKPSNLHSQQNRIRKEEQAALRQLDIQRILNSVRLLGYEVPVSPNALNDPATTFFHVSLGPINRLLALFEAIHVELKALMLILNQPVDALSTNPEVRMWKEQMLTRVLVEIIPALSILSERVGRDAAASLSLHNGGVRLNVGCS